MSGAEIGLALSVFLACAVEAVEALTIVLAVGITRSWSSALSGAGVAVLALAAIVAAFGPALTTLPIDVLRVLVGGLLLIFGLQWLRKAILRSAGLQAKHDELQIYQQQTEAAGAAGSRHAGFDGYAFTVSFKGVFLEGVEVAFIVLTFGASQLLRDVLGRGGRGRELAGWRRRSPGDRARGSPGGDRTGLDGTPHPALSIHRTGRLNSACPTI
jgi:uncharacterized membrane protein